MTKMTLNFFGDGEWAARTLKQLIQAGHKVELVVGRVNPTDESLQRCASEHGLEVRTPKNANEASFVEKVRKTGAELNVSVSYDQIIGRKLRQSASVGFLNCHAGKLPNYRGRSVINWAIINGEREVGVTAHFMDDGIDTGPIVKQTTVPVDWQDDFESVLRKVRNELPRVALAAVESLADGTAKERTQSVEQGTYYPKRGVGDEWIDWRMSSEDIYNKIRALAAPGPGTRTKLGDQTLIVWEAKYDLDWPHYKAIPGEVVGRTDSGVKVKTGDSTVLLEKVQFENQQKPEQPSFSIGTRLGPDPFREVLNLRQELNELERRLDEKFGEEW